MNLLEVQLWEGDGIEPPEMVAAREKREREESIRLAAERERLRLAALERTQNDLRRKSVWTLADGPDRGQSG